MNNDTPSAASQIPDIATLTACGAAYHAGLQPARRQALLAALPGAAHKLWRRLAGEVPESDLDDYVALGWMRWNGGRIELTDVGRNLTYLVDAYHAA